MKTRIVHTKFWKDNFIGELTLEEKGAFLYFLTNDSIGLTGIYELPDRNICFDLGIPQQKLNKFKEKFTDSGKIGFKDGYVILVNNQKYCDYENGSDRQKIAFENEKKSIPESIWKYREVLTSQKLVNKKSVSSFKLDLNHKTKIINKKGVVKGEEKNDDNAKKYLAMWNEIRNTRLTAHKPLENNLAYWLEQYTFADIREAIVNIAKDQFWKDKMTPIILLRKRNPRGEEVDYIGNLKSLTKTSEKFIPIIPVKNQSPTENVMSEEDRKKSIDALNKVRQDVSFLARKMSISGLTKQ